MRIDVSNLFIKSITRHDGQRTKPRFFFPGSEPVSGSPLRIHFFIYSLDTGGAEQYVTTLSRALHRMGWRVSIGVYGPVGRFGEELRREGDIAVIEHTKPGSLPYSYLLDLYRYLVAEKVDVVHGLMTGANAYAVLAGRLARVPVALMGVRTAIITYPNFNNRMLFRLDRLFSPFADLVIYNSFCGLHSHTGVGYPKKRTCVIQNMVDSSRFSHPLSEDEKEPIREELGIPSGRKVVSLIGRIDPFKNVELFVDAASAIAEKRKDAFFLIVGSGRKEYRDIVAGRISEKGLTGQNLLWVERMVTDVERFYSITDILALTSINEGVPNVVLEGMAAGLPIVATDVGDVSVLLDGGRCGFIVPPKDSSQLVSKISELLDSADLRRSFGEKARERARNEFSLESKVACFTETVSSLFAAKKG